MHRLGRGRGRFGRARPERRFHRPHRHPVHRAGPRNRLRADRRSVSRRADRARQGRAGRHRSDSDRQRDRRLAIDPDRGGNGFPRFGNPGRVAEGVGGRQAGGRGRRLGDRRRQGADRRNRPRHLLFGGRGATGRRSEIDRDRVVRAAERDLSQRHPRLRGGDRSRYGRDHHRSLFGCRRLRIHPESYAAGGAGPWRHRPGSRTGADGAGGVR